MTTVQDKSTNNYLTVLVIPVDQFTNNVFCLIDDLYNSLITAPPAMPWYTTKAG